MDEPARSQAVLRSSSRHVHAKQDHQDGSSSLLKILETSLDDLRAIITCRICIRPLYEPYTISCGHTFCYSCLLQWFEKDRTQKTCPDCRAKVIEQPAPAYLVRDITQIFVNRAELVPEGETTEEHRTWQQEEASAVEKDKKTAGQFRGGLFRGCFGHSLRINAPPIRDNQDGIDRCPRCTWELEDGYCTSCDYQVTGWGGGSPISYFDEEEIDHHYFGSNFIDSNPTSSEHSTDLEEDDAIASERVALRRRFRGRGRTIQSPLNRMNYMATPARYSETEDGLDVESDFSEDDGDAGSLDDFVVHDITDESRPQRRSPQSSHYDSDEITDIVNDFGRYSSDEDEHVPSEENENDQSGNLGRDRSIIQLDSDSDQGPVVRNRRFGVARSTRSLRLSSTDEDEHLAANLHNPSHRDITQQIRRSRNTASNAHNSYSSRDFAGFPIEIDTDSESDSLPTTRRRRANPHRIVSDDDDENDGNNGASIASNDPEVGSSRHSSNGTTTAGRRSSAGSSRTDLVYSTRRNPCPSSKTDVLDGSDTLRSAQSRHKETTLSPEDAPRGPRVGTSLTQFSSPSPALNSGYQNRRHHDENNSSPGSGSRATRARLARTSVELSGLESRVARLEQIRTPHQPSRSSPTQGIQRSPRSRQARIDELNTQIVRFRETQKRERRAAKQDRRARERASNMSHSLRPPSPTEEPMTWDSGLDYL